MSKRTAQFVSVLFAAMLASANFTAGAEDATANTDAVATADNCLTAPKGAAPAGGHWRYHVDRATKRKCWYVREETSKAPKAASAQQEPAPVADAGTPPAANPPTANPPQDNTGIAPSVANARAELATSQPNTAPAQPSVFDSAPNSGSLVTGRWLDQSSMASSGNSKPAADAAPPPQDDAQPAPQPAPPPAPLAAEAPAERQSGSTQNLLIVMAGALALAALVGGILFRLNRTSKPPYEVDNEWRAPWDPDHDRAQPQLQANREAPMRRARPPQRPIDELPSEQPERSFEDTQREIKDMLARLAKSATA